MTRRGLLFLSLTLLGPGSVAHAGSVKLRWDQCWGDGGVMNRNFACDTNVGSNALVGSFVSPVARSDAAGMQGVLDIAVATSQLPAWWHVESSAPAACRYQALTGSLAIPEAAANCEDWAQGHGLGPFVTYEIDLATLYRVRLRLETSVPFGLETEIVPGREYFAFRLTLNNLRTVGGSSCSGCAFGACLALNGITVVCADRGNNVSLHPGIGTGSVDDGLATWQGGGSITRPGPSYTDCPRATPVRNSTWGTVKALYR